MGRKAKERRGMGRTFRFVTDTRISTEIQIIIIQTPLKRGGKVSVAVGGGAGWSSRSGVLALYTVASSHRAAIYALFHAQTVKTPLMVIHGITCAMLRLRTSRAVAVGR